MRKHITKLHWHRGRAPWPQWLPYAITASVCWGIWGALAKEPSRQLSGWMTQVLFTLGLIPSAFVAFSSRRMSFRPDNQLGLVVGFFSGLFAGIGDLCFYLSLQSGADTAVAIPLISLYPLVTLAVAYFWFKERPNKTQVTGILLAVLAIILLSGAGAVLASPSAFVHRLKLTPDLVYIPVAIICAGLFTVFQKVSTNHISAELSFLSWCTALAVFACGIALTRPLNWDMPASIVAMALAAGSFNGFGVIAAFAAYRCQGKPAIVAPLTAMLQPLVTVLLALVFLGEHLGWIEGSGIFIAICAAAALSRECKQPAPGSQPSRN